MKTPNLILFQLAPRLPPVDIADLALMLELDLALGRKKDFRRRLDKAIRLAYRLGIKNGRSPVHRNSTWV